MSSYIVKTKFVTQGVYGSEEERTLYAVHNNTCDIISFYDDTGDYLFSVEDTETNNLFDAIERLYMPFNNTKYDIERKLKEGVEYVTKQEFNKLNENKS